MGVFKKRKGQLDKEEDHKNVVSDGHSEPAQDETKSATHEGVVYAMEVGTTFIAITEFQFRNILAVFKDLKMRRLEHENAIYLPDGREIMLQTKNEQTPGEFWANVDILSAMGKIHLVNA